jgi:glycosyltransferase involved in cell wall biosynthesis
VRVVHVPFGYFPDAVGGTEVYVAELARGLRARGVESIVAAPASPAVSTAYEHDGTRVFRFRVDPPTDVADLYGEGDEGAAHAIDAIVDDVDADVLHLHAFTRAASLRAARLARRRGVAVVFTYHTPTASCVRGTLLRDGREPCDGVLVAERCASCLLESRGVPSPVRDLLARAPNALGSGLAHVGASGGWATALRARELTQARHDAFRALLQEADAVVAVCEWVRQVLLAAGAPASRLALSRQGTPAVPRPRAGPPPADELRLAYVGRLHPTKGVHVILEAIAAERDLPIRIDVYGIAQDEDGSRYRDRLVALAGQDARVRFRAPVPADRVVETLADYDATVVPSQWLETGPLTALESFAAGVPVLGSNLGGIAELVTHDRDGWLVRHADVGAWRSALRRLASDRLLVQRLRAGVPLPRSTDDVAADMAVVYETIAPHAARSVAGAALG